MHAHATLLIDDGDLPSLALLGLHLEAARPILFRIPGKDRAEPGRRAMVERHAAMLGAAPVIDGPAAIEVHEGEPLSAGLHDAHVLMQATLAAVQLGCSRVVSPLVVGRDHQAVAAAFERAGSVQQLIERDGSCRSPLIELPLIDLTDAQVLELADDLRMPLNAFMPCHGSLPAPCGGCAGCLRWQEAFRQVGVVWPWKGSEKPDAADRTAEEPAAV